MRFHWFVVCELLVKSLILMSLMVKADENFHGRVTCRHTTPDTKFLDGYRDQGRLSPASRKLEGRRLKSGIHI